MAGVSAGRFGAAAAFGGPMLRSRRRPPAGFIIPAQPRVISRPPSGPEFLAIWYSTNNDRTQREMLKAAAAATGADRWKTLPKAQEHLKWLLDRRADDLAEEHNNAIRAPAALYLGSESPEMGPSAFSGHSRARKLMGKKLLIEFDWCERYAETLSQFAGRNGHRVSGRSSVAQ
jgi:hypothetical protein